MEDYDKFEFEMLKAQLDSAQRDNAVLAQRLAALETSLATMQLTVDDLQSKATDATDESQVVSTPAAELVEPFNDVTQMVDPDNAATEQQLFKDAQNGVKERRSTEWSPDAVGGGPIGLHKFTELAEHKVVLLAETNSGSGSQSGAGTVTFKLEVDHEQELPQGYNTGDSQEKWAIPIRRRTSAGSGYILEWARPGGEVTVNLPSGGGDCDCCPPEFSVDVVSGSSGGVTGHTITITAQNFTRTESGDCVSGSTSSDTFFVPDGQPGAPGADGSICASFTGVAGVSIQSGQMVQNLKTYTFVKSGNCYTLSGGADNWQPIGLAVTPCNEA